MIILKKEIYECFLGSIPEDKEINHIDNTIFKIGPNKVYNPRIVYEVID